MPSPKLQLLVQQIPDPLEKKPLAILLEENMSTTENWQIAITI
jgi:hypothetical protein